MAMKRPGVGLQAAGESGRESGPPNVPGPPLGTFELFASVFGTGAAVMVIEILGTRIIGPVFGVNLFVWAALLTVTLGALAAGYYTGGVLVDRSPNPRLLGLIILVAGALLGLVPTIRHAILSSTADLGPRWGPLVSATLLFAPSLAVLGMTGPVAVRLATRDLTAAGHRVGSIYAVSTAGSLIGTLVVAFALVPNLETNHILVGTACFLVLLGAGPLAWRRRPAAFLGLLVPLFGLMAGRPALPAGFEILARAQSLHGLLEVIEDRNRGFRALRADHSLIGAHWNVDRTPTFSFLHLLESVRFARPHARNALQIGLGIGSLPMLLANRGITSDVVEIDPGVVRLARDYFGFSTAGTVFTEDARALIQRLEDHRYDIIVHDTFTGGTVPEHLFSLEVVQRLQSLLRPGGLLAVNFVGYTKGPNDESSLAIARTLKAIFPTVRTFRDMSPDELPESVSNIIFFASDAPVDFSIPADTRFENDVCERTLKNFTAWELFKGTLPPGPLITDDKNPLGQWQLATASNHFSFMKDLIPAEVWLD
jgi:MFS family permease